MPFVCQLTSVTLAAALAPSIIGRKIDPSEVWPPASQFGKLKSHLVPIKAQRPRDIMVLLILKKCVPACLVSAPRIDLPILFRRGANYF